MMNKHRGPAVRATGVSVTRGRRQILKGVALTVPRGRITGLLGPPGCGKTTLLRAVAGVQRRVTGTLEVLDEPAGSAALRPRVGYVPQSPSVYDDLTVRENLDYFAAVRRPQRADREERVASVRRAIEEVGLTSYQDELAADLPGGPRSRVPLAVALLGSPELLVLDEPAAGLDPGPREELWRLLAGLAADRGTALLVSSPVLDEAERCHRLLLMREGRVLAAGSPAALRARLGAGSVAEAFARLVRQADPDAPAEGG